MAGALSAVLPHVTAGLNALAGLLLCLGFHQIRSGRLAGHRAVMTAAAATSALFLAAYLLHHLIEPLHPFPGQGLSRPVYFTLLGTHIALAALCAPLAAMTFLRGRAGWRQGQGSPAAARHRALARWTLPLWLYVSASGIAVYVMLYHLYAVPLARGMP